MALPNLLATPRGRLAAFFLLYVTEGIPLGFVVTAVATQLRRMGVGPAEIGTIVAAFYLPWAFKWAVGPVVDVVRSRRWGHRRAWIIGTQLAMAGTLMSIWWVPMPQEMALFVGLLLVHNAFGATQDVAIDALAVGSLADDERGLANGLMFAGAQVGQALGGAGTLYLSGYTGFDATYAIVPATILLVTVLVVLPMREAASPGTGASGLRDAGREMRAFVEQAFRAFLGSRSALAGVAYALLPNGALALSLALQANLAVEFGMNDAQVASLSLATTLLGAGCMVLGGWMSDRFGRRRMLALFLVLMSVPTAYLAWMLHRAGYVMPRAPGSPPIPELITQLWIAGMVHAAALGLMYGPRTAVFMDITDARVAATQFTAYMAMLNVAIAFAATWQGIAVEALGYPTTLLLDALAGLLSLPLLPLLKRAAEDVAAGDPKAEARARTCAAVLAVGCAAFVPWWLLHDPKGPAAGVANTVYTLVFVCSALFLVAGTLLQAQTSGWRLVHRVMAVVLIGLYARRFLPAAPPEALKGLVAVVAVFGAVLLARLSRQAWPGLALRTPAPAPAAASAPAPAAGRESPAG